MAIQWGHGMNQATRSHVGSINHGSSRQLRSFPVRNRQTLIHDHCLPDQRSIRLWVDLAQSPGPWEWKTSGIEKDRSPSTAVSGRRHGEERERNEWVAIGGGERVKPYEMPLTVTTTTVLAAVVVDMRTINSVYGYFIDSGCHFCRKIKGKFSSYATI